MSSVGINKHRASFLKLGSLSMLLSLAFILAAQNTFNKKYDFTSNIDIAYQLIKAHDALFIIGNFADTVSFSYKIGIIKTDMDGNLIWKKKYGIDSLTYGAYSLSPALLYEDSIIYIHVFRQLYGSGISKCALMKLNTNGDLYWEKEMPGNNFELACGLVENNGSLYLGGVGYPDGVNRDAFIYKVNLEGDSLYKKYLPFMYESLALLFYLTKNEFICSDLVKVSGIYFPVFYQIDSLFNVLDTLELKGMTDRDGVLLAQNTDYEFEGILHIYDTLVGSDYAPNLNVLIKIDTSFKLNFIISFPFKKETLLSKMAFNSGYKYLFYYEEYFSTLGKDVGFLLKLNQENEIIWERRYYIPDTTNQLFDDIQFTDDGYIYLTGISYNSVSPTSQEDYWLVKLDSFGCLTPGCQLYDGIVDLSLPSPELSIKISPNPATESCNFYVEGAGYYNGKMLEVGMYDLNGKKHWQASQQILGNLPQFTISRKKCASGMYIIKATVNGKEVGSEKLVWK